MLRTHIIQLLIAGSVLGMATPAAFADEAVKDNDRANAVSVELLGRGLAYSINYDRMISDEIGVGIGFTTLSTSVTSADGTDTETISVTIIPLYLDYYFYRSGGNGFYGTGGIDIVSASLALDGAKASGSGVGFTVGGGYEYRADNGFLFRGALYIFALDSITIFRPGISLGYTF